MRAPTFPTLTVGNDNEQAGNLTPIQQPHSFFVDTSRAHVHEVRDPFHSPLYALMVAMTVHYSRSSDAPFIFDDADGE